MEKVKEKNPVQISVSQLIDHFMSPQSSCGFVDHVKLKGKIPEGESPECFCIDVYVNNNIQGVNHSILLGNLNVDKGDLEPKQKKRKMIKRGIRNLLLLCDFLLFFLIKS
ncbi:hypothetical protein NE237_014498 [Protea cynaroides]|uniref:Uncharacterized protein n=1 Tax=Protea cynaroides TaxID=273540 RepID=A0A9Q0QQ54_9MAGN|nr:hypothetical protein NE237_014498 [Protea cynaroides]